MEVTARMTESAMVARAAAAGSMVLLKNLHHTLPLLAEGTEPLPIAVFGSGQIRTALSAGIQPWRTVNVLDGLTASDQVTPDGLLAHKYRNFLLGNPDLSAADGGRTGTGGRGGPDKSRRRCDYPAP